MNLKRAEPDPEVAAMGGVVRFEGWTAGSGIMPPGVPWTDLVPNNRVVDSG